MPNYVVVIVLASVTFVSLGWAYFNSRALAKVIGTHTTMVADLADIFKDLKSSIDEFSGRIEQVITDLEQMSKTLDDHEARISMLEGK